MIQTLNSVDASPDLAMAKDILTRYLEGNGYRKTPERYTILREIYRRDDHFDAETLYVHMKRENYHISRATVYNTLDLLVQCNLVLKHHFDIPVAKFEKAIGKPIHHHMVCTGCGKIIEFSHPDLTALTKEATASAGFVPSRHSLVIYGKCPGKCE